MTRISMECSVKALNHSKIKSLTSYQSMALFYFVNGEDASVS